jgi:hypothetical protein
MPSFHSLGDTQALINPRSKCWPGLQSSAFSLLSIVVVMPASKIDLAQSMQFLLNTSG